ncbi:MAG: hypothetical protein QF393_08080 [Rhodospirillales bacterium]|nr:hypothetical protein [Rhodospirillales bacterium]MDP6645996.1 hypothetical protein [Rhodospirillales bacterium]
MIYSVKANLVAEHATEFLRNLTDGTIAQQRPDGGEIVASMERARITNDGYVRWTEACFCSTPLKHERETQLDRYFSEIEVELVDAHKVFDGTSLMAHLVAGSTASD